MFFFLKVEARMGSFLGISPGDYGGSVVFVTEVKIEARGKLAMVTFRHCQLQPSQITNTFEYQQE